MNRHMQRLAVQRASALHTATLCTRAFTTPCVTRVPLASFPAAATAAGRPCTRTSAVLRSRAQTRRTFTSSTATAAAAADDDAELEKLLEEEQAEVAVESDAPVGGRALGSTLPSICLLSDTESRELMTAGVVDRIRNFSIIAHIDHGKSTLADRLLESAGNIRALSKEDAQVLDNLQVERERGITVKAQTASMFYRDPRTGFAYVLNLIDTPGHVDFSYEVSRSLAACQGALLLVDSAQGVQAQTLANYYTAMDANLDIIPVLSKIDLPHADIKSAGEQIQVAFDMDPATALPISSKTGVGIDAVFSAIIDRIRAPPSVLSDMPMGTDPLSIPLRALMFDSWFDIHRGVICLIKVVDGAIRKGDKIASFHGDATYDVQEVGLMTGRGQREMEVLHTGSVGYLIAGIKTTREVRLGETFCTYACEAMINGRRLPVPMP
jgi:small GTP-binding protein